MILLGLQTYTNADIIKGEPVFIESCKKLQKQLVICLNIGKVHGQLRRLRNESSILDDAVITAIPSYKSKVLFTPAKMRPLYRGIEYYLQPSNCEGVVSSYFSYFTSLCVSFGPRMSNIINILTVYFLRTVLFYTILYSDSAFFREFNKKKQTRKIN